MMQRKVFLLVLLSVLLDARAIELTSCWLRDEIFPAPDPSIPSFQVGLIQCIASGDIYVKSTLNTSNAHILYNSSISEIQAALKGTVDVTGGSLNFAENAFALHGNLKMQCANKTLPQQVLHAFPRTRVPVTPSITRAPMTPSISIFDLP